jgi:uncharacterized Fe-S cluster-containing radical SAM superfamily protein
MASIRARDLYRMPWSAVDNVNGWIEPTTRCNLRCRACYRREQHETLPFDQMRAYVDRTIEARNCEHISIAGGEPLLVDYLEDLVRHVRAQGCRVTVLTNGVLLDDARLASLAAAGLDRINLHVDAGQDRPGWEGADETELLELRQEILDRVHVHGIQCSTISVVYQETLAHLPRVLEWAVANHGRLCNLTLDLFRYYPHPRHVARCFAADGRDVDPAELGRLAVVDEEPRLTIDEVVEVVARTLEGFAPHSYLNGTAKQSAIKWLLTTAIVREGEVVGYLGRRAVELATVAHHWRHGRYPSFVGGRTRHGFLAAAVFDRDVRRAVRRLAGRIARRPWRAARPVDLLSIAIVQPTDWYTDGLQNMCDACPDAMLWGDLLVPSCRLDEYRRFGSAVQHVMCEEIRRDHEDLGRVPARAKRPR